MFYEVFLVLLGIYIEQTYNLPSINGLLSKLKKTTEIDTNETIAIVDNTDTSNFLNDFYSIFTKNTKKK